MHPADVEDLRTRAIAEITYGHRREEAIERLVTLGAPHDFAIELVDEAIDERNAIYRGRGILELVSGLTIVAAIAIAYTLLDFASITSPVAHLFFGFIAIAGLALAASGAGHIYFGAQGAGTG